MTERISEHVFIGDAQIEVTTWSGLPNYHCPACVYADTDLESLKSHLSCHQQEPQPVVRQSVILGPDGKPFTVTEEVPCE
jgi:hypothetical protein